MSQITVHVDGFGDKPISLHCELHTKVVELKAKLLAHIASKTPFDFMLAFGGVHLEDDKSLAFFGVQDESIVVLAVSDAALPPGYCRVTPPPISSLDMGTTFHEVLQVVKELPKVDAPPAAPPFMFGHTVFFDAKEEEEEDMTEMLETLEIVTSPKGRDMLTLQRQESGKSPRYIMPCEHIISAQSLKNFCQNTLDSTELPTEFCCPESSCKAKWPYPLVRKVADLTKELRKEFEIKLSENLLEHKLDIGTCPKCKTRIARTRQGHLKVQCAACFEDKTKDAGKMFVYCWKCKSEWKDVECKDDTFCGNEVCAFSESSFRSEVLSILQNCNKITIGNVPGVPDYRACPKCGQLISHVAACKHMSCKKRRCNTNFCFVCLGVCDENGYKCGGYNDVCPVAPVQTDADLPKFI